MRRQTCGHRLRRQRRTGSPDVRQMLQQVQDCSRRLENAMQQQFRQKAQELERLQDRLKLQSPAHRQELAQQELCHLQKRLEAGIRQIWQQCQEQLVQQTNRLDMLSPMKILGRGYALAYHAKNWYAVPHRCSPAMCCGCSWQRVRSRQRYNNRKITLRVFKETLHKACA